VIPMSQSSYGSRERRLNTSSSLQDSAQNSSSGNSVVKLKVKTGDKPAVSKQPSKLSKHGIFSVEKRLDTKRVTQKDAGNGSYVCPKEDTSSRMKPQTHNYNTPGTGSGKSHPVAVGSPAGTTSSASQSNSKTPSSQAIKRGEPPNGSKYSSRELRSAKIDRQRPPPRTGVRGGILVERSPAGSRSTNGPDRRGKYV